jgi:hypothetical protein
VDYPAYKVSEIGWRRPRPDNCDIGSVSKVVGNPPPGIISGLLVIRPLTANVPYISWQVPDPPISQLNLATHLPGHTSSGLKIGVRVS